MKKMIMFLITLMLVMCISISVNATTIDTLSVQIDKTIVRPGEDVTITINFGQYLGAGDFNVFFDNNIFDYVSNQGGTANASNNKVAVSYYNATDPIDRISVTFRAKAGIKTSNPTELTVTANDLVNADASVFFEDISTPIVKNLTVEPVYDVYTLSLIPNNTLIKEYINDMTLSYGSLIGRYYANARLIAEVTTPGNAVAKLLATDSEGLEHDIIQSGWGNAQGYPIGGENFSQVLNVRGFFTDVGKYTITLKLIDRGNSDTVIAQNSFGFDVTEIAQLNNPDNQLGQLQQSGNPVTNLPENSNSGGQAVVQNSQESAPAPTTSSTPVAFIYTGKDNYIPIFLVVLSLVILGVCSKKNNTKNSSKSDK